MRASRRTSFAAPRTKCAALIGAGILACLLAVSGMMALAQTPGEAVPAEVPAEVPVEDPAGAPAPPPDTSLPQPDPSGLPSEPSVLQPEPDESIPPRREHDRARDAVREGQALPLGNIIRELQRTCPGTFLNAVLEERDGKLVYRLQTLTPAGRRLFTIVDAATGAVVSGGCR